MCVVSQIVDHRLGSGIDSENRRCIRQHQTNKAGGTKDKGAGSNFEQSVDGCWRLVLADFACWECVGSRFLIDRADFEF